MCSCGADSLQEKLNSTLIKQSGCKLCKEGRWHLQRHEIERLETQFIYHGSMSCYSAPAEGSEPATLFAYCVCKVKYLRLNLSFLRVLSSKKRINACRISKITSRSWARTKKCYPGKKLLHSFFGMRSVLQDGLMKRERQEMSAGCAYGIGLVVLREIKNR